MIRDARFHCRRHAQRSVNPAEIVEREVQCDCGLVVVQFLVVFFFISLRLMFAFIFGLDALYS